MGSNVCNIIQRIAGSCLLLRHHGGADRQGGSHDCQREEDQGEELYKINNINNWEKGVNNGEKLEPPKIMELQLLTGQVLEAVKAMKRAYVGLQEAHFPWDTDTMRVADVAVATEIWRLGLLGEKFRRSIGGAEQSVREMAAQYEATLEGLKREVKLKQEDVDALREKLAPAAFGGNARQKAKKSKRRVACTSRVAVAPASELFEATMSCVKEASKAFASMLLSLMHSARWDISAVVRSIESSNSSATTKTYNTLTDSTAHSKYAIESYVNKKIFQGFTHESFRTDETFPTTTTTLRPDKSRRDCFAHYRDMTAMDPLDLLSVLPTCGFGRFCISRYMSIVHPKMEESLFGDLSQRCQLMSGRHPRNRFYAGFLELSKAVWLLHLLAFSLDPPPSHFETRRWDDFHAEYMESVVRAVSGGSLAVGFQVSPGFMLANGSVVKARVYVVPKSG